MLYKAVVLDATSSSQVKCIIDLGFGVQVTRKVRLEGIEPARRDDPIDRTKARNRDVLARELLEDRTVQIEMSPDFATGVFYCDGQNVNQRLQRIGHRPLTVGLTAVFDGGKL